MEGKVLGVSGVDRGGDALDDFKYISGLSTILVATIQEVKDRVSQMEFIFCSQLFPHFQAKSKLLHGQLADAVKAAKDEWREREAGLVSQLEELSSGKRHAEEKLLQLGSSLEEMKGKLADAERLVVSHDIEKQQLRGRLEKEMGKDELIRRLEMEIAEKAADVLRERDAHQRLLQKVEIKDKDLLLEQNKRRDLIDNYTQLKTNYKHLKSQYTFLVGKIDQNEGSKVPLDNLVDQKTSESPPSKRKLKDLVDIKKESIEIVSMTRDQKNDTASCAKAQSTQHASSVRSPFNNSRLSLPSHPTNSPPKNAVRNSKQVASSSFTHPNLHWRETRVRKEPGVVDPHDDFLDTPLEAVKNMIRKPTTPEEAQALAASPRDMDFNNSDDETQDINIATQDLKNMPVLKRQSTISIQPLNKGFKYTEPVRKKADRQNLKGVECKQCKKFYDAVLPDGRSNDDGAGLYKHEVRAS
ncbi:hypothetical protein GUJ93_ZPchr0012g19138 [Zizania palustris]|uniref:DNA endonuclease activator Ctp1 C-terminal domain-containing protein n=1 Tax=Zizania palustris TaxID=103762 RepID=A0A8J5WQC8_ZIZPA|nr:hypothetical protein GUJ93_ZPchr0012g19138 [Zizania palustris]